MTWGVELHTGNDAAAAADDGTLLERVRGNDLDALGELYARHRDAATRVARAVTSDASFADDLVSGAFERIHAALLRGHGPTEAFRPYLYTVIRRLAAEQSERASHEHDVDDWAPLEAGFAMLPADTAEGRLVRGAFASLPRRHQAVLWYLDVEGMHPAEAAPIFGLSANAVSALAVRARDGLRDAYLQAHVSTRRVRPECVEIRRHLGAYVGGRISDRDRTKVEIHLETCDECPLVVAELREERGRLRAILLPLVVGGAAAGVLGLGAPESAEAAEVRPASVASMTKEAIRRPGVWIAAAATIALLIAGGLAALLVPRDGSGAGGGVEAGRDAVPAVATGDPHPAGLGEASGGAAAGEGDGPSSAGPEGGDVEGSGASAAPEPGAGEDPDATGGSPASDGGVPGTTGGGTGGSAPPTSSGTDPGSSQPSAAPAPVPPPAPVVPTITAGLTIDQAGSILTGSRSAGTVTVRAENVGPVSLGGTLEIALPSGVQYDDGLVRSVLGLVGSLVTTGAVQTCSHTATQVVCQVVSLVPGAAASVSIPVAVASGAEGADPAASFRLG